MSNDSKKLSELLIATTLSANDRVVMLTNPDSAANAHTIKLTNFGASLANNMPVANSTQLGVIKIGAGLAVAANGTVTAPLPIASATVTGVVKIGSNINVDADGIISVNLIPTTGGTTGKVFLSNAQGVGSWQAFSGVNNLTTITTPGAVVYPVQPNDSVILIDPNAVGADVEVILPITSGILGKIVTIKNMNPGVSNYRVKVTTDRPSFSYIENPENGALNTTYYITNKSQTEAWIFDSTGIYNHLWTFKR